MSKTWLRDRLVDRLVNHRHPGEAGRPSRACQYCTQYYGHIVDQVMEVLEEEFITQDWRISEGPRGDGSQTQADRGRAGRPHGVASPVLLDPEAGGDGQGEASLPETGEAAGEEGASA